MRTKEVRIMRSDDGVAYPRPLVRIVGGKSWFRGHLPRHVPRDTVRRYHETCIGGGATFGALSALGLLDGATAIIGDRDLGLARAWATVRDYPDDVATCLETYEREAQFLGRDLYKFEKLIYNAAPEDPDPHRVIWLRFATHTGLWRVSASGKLNVVSRPAAELRRLPLPSRAELRAWSVLLRKHRTSVLHHDATYYDAKDEIEVGEGDLLFVDPPYARTFTSYTAAGFDLADQERLLQLCAQWTERGARVIYTNADNELVRDLLKRLWPMAYAEVQMVSRTVNSKKSERGCVPELVVSSHSPLAVDPASPSPPGLRAAGLIDLPSYHLQPADAVVGEDHTP
jgi:DNA adenine methylase